MQHNLNARPHHSERTGEDGWLVVELTGTTTVTCPCGLNAVVANGEVLRLAEEHSAGNGEV